MASYVEKVLDFLERMVANNDVPKTLQEDLEWAIGIISANKLYTGGLLNFKLNEDRPEIKAWCELISLKSIPINKAE